MRSKTIAIGATTIVLVGAAGWYATRPLGPTRTSERVAEALVAGDLDGVELVVNGKGLSTEQKRAIARITAPAFRGWRVVGREQGKFTLDQGYTKLILENSQGVRKKALLTAREAPDRSLVTMENVVRLAWLFPKLKPGMAGVPGNGEYLAYVDGIRRSRQDLESAGFSGMRDEYGRFRTWDGLQNWYEFRAGLRPTP